MGKYDTLKDQYRNQANEADADFAKALQGMQEMAADAADTAELYRNAEKELADIDMRFMSVTKLDKTDVAFLMLATALQISRWIIIGKINQSVSEKINKSRVDHDDKDILAMEKEKRQEYKKKHGDTHVKGKHRDWANIIFDGVPYDVTKGSPLFNVNMEAGLHRIHTLGHDPILGWIFGTMNILSDSITLEDFRTFDVCMDKGRKRWTGPTTLPETFYDAYDSIREDSSRLPAAVFAQALHLRSDVYTKYGLPVPILETFSPEFAGKIYKEGYDTLLLMKDVAVVGIQALSSILINMLIAVLHSLFYDENKYHQDKNLYQIKTRKILLLSNAIASSSNVIWVGGNAWMGNESAWKDLDIGGIMVTAYRLVTDIKFISRIKKEFLDSEWQKRVIGEEYSFITEENNVSKKDIKKGIEIQARADAAKQDKVAKGLEHQAAVLKDIESGQQRVHAVVGEVLDGLAAEEAKTLFDLDITKSPRDLGTIEKQALCAALYTLMDRNGQNSDYQKAFYLNLEKYLGVSKRISTFNFDNLNNIDSHVDRKVILKVICAFLSLGDPSFSFSGDQRYSWLVAFTSEKEMAEACDEIKREFSVLGEMGIVNRYKAIDVSSNSLSIPKEPSSGSADQIDSEELSEESDDFSALKELIHSYVRDEAAFGKQLKSLPTALIKELKKTYPMLNPSTMLFGSKVGNGYLLFSTHAFYLKLGNMLKGEYVRVPYCNIEIEKLATAAGKAKSTRKLLVSYKDSYGKKQSLVIDDTKITEERLQELLKDIVESGSRIADTDFDVNMPELSVDEQVLYFKALGNIVQREGHLLTELYLIVRDYGFCDRWAEIAEAFTENNDLSAIIQAFVDRIPYPSSRRISQQAVMLALQTIFRTNHLENREVSVLTAESEALIRLFDINDLDDKSFNSIIKMASESARNPEAQTVFDLSERLGKDVPYAESILDGLSVMKADLEKLMKQQKKGVGDTLKDAARGLPKQVDIKGSAEKIKDGAGRMLAGFRSKSKNESLKLPEDYQRLKQKFPEGMGIPKEAVGYGMRTESASCLLIMYPVSEDISMPFDNPQWVIDEQHRIMGENEGLIEVRNGTTSKGHPYVYDIIKHRINPEDEIPSGVEYTLNINVRMENTIQFINGSFAEEGTTGMRDSVCFAMFSQGSDEPLDERMKNWFADPYDPNYKKGFLMNLSEKEDLDEQFPWHPLSVARAFIRYIINNN